MLYGIHPDDVAGMMGTELEANYERFAGEGENPNWNETWEYSPKEMIQFEIDHLTFYDLPSLIPAVVVETKQEVNWMMGDFTCSHCHKDFFVPHEGLFFGNIEPDVLCIDCSVKENNIS